MGQNVGREAEASPAQRIRQASQKLSSSRLIRDSSLPQGSTERAHHSSKVATNPRISSKTRVDDGYVVRQGIYHTRTDYDDATVRRLIVERKLCPFFPGAENEEDLPTTTVRSECPICFLYFPTPLNHARCCLQPICTECFVQIQRVDPATHVPPSSSPAACPFCMVPDFGVVYQSCQERPDSNAEAAIEHAATAIGTGGAQAQGRASFGADDARVVLVDHIHPKWKEKLDRALQNMARTENRRVIMRQDGDTLVPIGVSSSHTGDALASFVEQNSHLGHNGPGGSIVLHAHEFEQEMLRYLQQGSPLQRARQSLDRSRPLHLSPEALDEIILRETMRRSRLEHEEQQRRQSTSGPRPESRTGSSHPLSLLPRRLANVAALKHKRNRSEADDGPQKSSQGEVPASMPPPNASTRPSVSVEEADPVHAASSQAETPRMPSPIRSVPTDTPLSTTHTASDATPPSSLYAPPELATSMQGSASQTPAASTPVARHRFSCDATGLSNSPALLGMQAWGHTDATTLHQDGGATPRTLVQEWEKGPSTPDSASDAFRFAPSQRVRYSLLHDAASNLPGGMTTNPFRARAASIATPGL